MAYLCHFDLSFCRILTSLIYGAKRRDNEKTLFNRFVWEAYLRNSYFLFCRLFASLICNLKCRFVVLTCVRLANLRPKKSFCYLLHIGVSKRKHLFVLSLRKLARTINRQNKMSQIRHHTYVNSTMHFQLNT